VHKTFQLLNQKQHLTNLKPGSVRGGVFADVQIAILYKYSKRIMEMLQHLAAVYTNIKNANSIICLTTLFFVLCTHNFGHSFAVAKAATKCCTVMIKSEIHFRFRCACVKQIVLVLVLITSVCLSDVHQTYGS